MTGNIAAAAKALDHLDIDDNPATLKQKSRDFFWYSPVLKAEMDHLIGDFVVSPRSEAEVIEVLKACYAHDVPVTTRGAGTGNYGQAMPLPAADHAHEEHDLREGDRPGPRDRRAGHRGQGPRRRNPRPFGPGVAHDALHLRHRHHWRLHRRRLRRHRLGALGRAARSGQHPAPACGHHGGRAARSGIHRRGPCPRLPRLRHQWHHHRNRDAAGPGL
jgi:hypothetical protein